MKFGGFEFSEKQVFFTIIFSFAALLAQQINFSAMVMPLGVKESPFFTLFQFFAPIAGAFLGGFAGVAAVLLAQIATAAINIFALGKQVGAWTFFGVLPMLFAAWYFSQGKENAKTSALVALGAISLFLLHPVGREVWYFAAMFWMIPIAAKLLLPENLLAKSLGATMAAHAVGGSMWIWVFPTTAAYWVGLVPVVAFERSMFAAGIAVSYVAMNTLLYHATEKTGSKTMRAIASVLHVNPKYALFAR